jgi:glycolate oxidase FAD binding subunit
MRAADAAGATAVSRAALGLTWLALPGGDDLAERAESVRRALPGATVSVLDGAATLGGRWPEPAGPALEVMRRLKARFDPAGLFRPGAFVGGI